MKVYRVMPDSFYVENYLNESKKTSFEDIYYKMGYVLFSDQTIHSYNSIYRKLSEDEKKHGKYFFLFIEDAISNGLFLLKAMHALNVNTFLITEYDVEDDLVLKHVGYGDYSRGIFKHDCMECFITKEDMDGLNISSKIILPEERESEIFAAFDNSIKTIADYGDAAPWAFEFYKNYFGVDDLSTILEDKNELRQKLVNSALYDSFMNTEHNLIKSPFITGKTWRINEFDNLKAIIQCEEPYGNRFTDSDEQYYFKKQLQNYSNLDGDEAKEKVKSLLKDKNYM